MSLNCLVVRVHASLANCSVVSGIDAMSGFSMKANASGITSEVVPFDH